ncbi:hypothetical protein pb186bvf_018259 [Paramecium bursaria]
MFAQKDISQAVKPKLLIESELNSKTRKIFEPGNFIPQMDQTLKDSLKECERKSPLKGIDEQSQFRNGLISHEKVIEAVRAANYTEIQNVHSKYKRVLLEVLETIANQLGDLFKREYLKIWEELRESKLIIQEREVKIKNQHAVLEEQESQLAMLRNNTVYNLNMSSQKKLLEDQINRLLNENKKLKDDLQKLKELYDGLRNKYDDLDKQYKDLKNQFDEMKAKYEKQIFELEQQMKMQSKENSDLIDLVKQLQMKLDKYKELYEKELKINDNLIDQLRYWKSTHQQRLVDLQNTECRADSQKGYLFKYRREVEDLKRYKLIGQEAQKEAIMTKQQLYIMQQKTQELRQNQDTLIQQARMTQQTKADQLNDLLLQFANPKKSNTCCDMYYESPSKGQSTQKFDFTSVRKINQTQENFKDEVNNIIAYGRTPSPFYRNRARMGSAHSKRNISVQDFNKVIETEHVTPAEKKKSRIPIRRVQTQS